MTALTANKEAKISSVWSHKFVVSGCSRLSFVLRWIQQSDIVRVANTGGQQHQFRFISSLLQVRMWPLNEGMHSLHRLVQSSLRLCIPLSTRIVFTFVGGARIHPNCNQSTDSNLKRCNKIGPLLTIISAHKQHQFRTYSSQHKQCRRYEAPSLSFPTRIRIQFGDQDQLS